MFRTPTMPNVADGCLLQDDLLRVERDRARQRAREAAFGDELRDRLLARGGIGYGRQVQVVHEEADVGTRPEAGEFLRIGGDVARGPHVPDGERCAVIEREEVGRAEEAVLPVADDVGPLAGMPLEPDTVDDAVVVGQRAPVVFVADDRVEPELRTRVVERDEPPDLHPQRAVLVLELGVGVVVVRGQAEAAILGCRHVGEEFGVAGVAGRDRRARQIRSTRCCCALRTTCRWKRPP